MSLMDFHGPFVYVLAISEPAPTGSFVQVGANDIGVPQATYPKSNNSASHCIRPAVVLDSLGLVVLSLSLSLFIKNL